MNAAPGHHPHLAFHGAAGTVTGSCFLLSVGGARILVDCGLFQGPNTVRALNWRDLPFDPRAIDVLVLTHAHTDHAGLIPRLTRAGFRGPVICTEATLELCQVMLPDSGGIQEADVRARNRRHVPRGEAPVTPIYTRADAEAALERFQPRPFDTWFDLPGGARGRFWNAGHLLGSASVEIAHESLGHESLGSILFSGDIGPEEKVFHAPPEAPCGIDWLVMECTYGDRARTDPAPEERRAQLAATVRAALDRGGNLLIPAFAVERTQELLHDLDLLMERGTLRTAPIVIDSPLAQQATAIFRRHTGDIDPAERTRTPLSGSNIRFTHSVEESKALNRVHGGMIILSASGMAEAGRIRHHLMNNLFRPQATVLFVGHQAAGTLGRLLLDGAEEVRIMGQNVVVRAQVGALDLYSGHADRGGLEAWLRARLPVRKGVFLVHGEVDARAAFQGFAAGLVGQARVHAPGLDSVFALAPDGARPESAGARLAPEAAARAFDWKNERAALLLALEKRLAALPDDAAREGLLRRMRRSLADGQAGPRG